MNTDNFRKTWLVAGLCLALAWLSTACSISTTDKLPAAEQAALAGQPVFGPQSGQLEHNVEDERIPYLSTDISLANFVAEVTFTNPQAAQAGPWDYGLLFRLVPGTSHYRLILYSDQRWQLKVYDALKGELVDEGKLDNLDVSEGAKNKLRLYANGPAGALYINDQKIADLHLSKLQQPGNLWVATGLWTGDETNGKVTLFDGLTVWEVKAKP